jgi:mRNA interferase RelE/StbE
MYRVKFLDSALRDISALDKTTAKRILNRLQWLAENFDKLGRGALRGDFSDYYKFRVGDYRILYKVLEDEKFIQIHVIGHRREIYRGRK